MLDIELHEHFCNFAATSTDTANICAMGGHLHMSWLSKYTHVISCSLAGRVCQHCQLTGRNAERLRKQRRGVARKATVLTTGSHNVTLSIWNLWLCRCEGRVLEFGTRGQETGSCSSDMEAWWRYWEVDTEVFCWILTMTTAAWFQAITSDSENKSSSQFSVLTCGNDVPAVPAILWSERLDSYDHHTSSES
jgi:hypothetical protein